MHWKIKGRIAGILLLAGSFVSANHDLIAGRAAAGDGDPVVSFANDDPTMNQAQSEAISHLDQFMSLVMQNNGVARGDAAIKVAMPTDGAGDEVIWVTPFAIHNGAFLGRLANEPQALPKYRAGDTVHFIREQVRDWSFMGPEGKIYGSYTTRALLPHLDPNQAAEIALLLSDNPLPMDW